MRISDWSSDVCSSDLMAAGSAMLLVGGDVAALAACDDVLAAISDKRIHFGPSGSGAAAKVINNAVAHAVMAVVAEAGSMATAAGVDCEKLVGRSEEHTSELQSLMRISYAVFCLKKKTLTQD